MKKNWIKYLMKLFAAAVALSAVLQFVLVPTKVVMSSMHPTLDDGQYVIINRLPYKLTEPKRGDVIVFSLSDSGSTLIKRVIGLPGECIRYCQDKCFINHRLLDEQEDKGMTDYMKDFPPAKDHTDCLRLKENQFFVLGDNRPVSLDSRSFGPIQRDGIVGKMILKTPFGDR